MRLYAWFNQGGRLEVVVPDPVSAEEYRHLLTQQVLPGVWLNLTDGSVANLSQVVRLEIADG